MDGNFWCITVVFNPAGYDSRINNYFIFKSRLEKQNINLLTIELTFNNQSHTLPNSVKLHSNSIMWQKERLINHAISLLPDNCDKFAWLDADLLLPDGWDVMAKEKLDQADFVQLFEKVTHLQPGQIQPNGEKLETKNGIVWQQKQYGNDWLKLRREKKIYHTEPGFGWAAKRSALKNGLYDKLICGSGDNFLVDCLLDSSSIHHYLTKFTDHMLTDMDEWKSELLHNTNKSIDYLPIEIYHLWHGSAKNRGYLTRDLIFKEHDYDPKTDIKMTNNVWEWTSNKPKFHQSIVDYFQSRKEDGDKTNSG